MNCSTCSLWSPPSGKGKLGQCNYKKPELFNAISMIPATLGMKVEVRLRWPAIRPEKGEGCEFHEPKP